MGCYAALDAAPRSPSKRHCASGIVNSATPQFKQTTSLGITILDEAWAARQVAEKDALRSAPFGQVTTSEEGNLLFGSLGRTGNPGRGQRPQAAELCGAAWRYTTVFLGSDDPEASETQTPEGRATNLSSGILIC